MNMQANIEEKILTSASKQKSQELEKQETSQNLLRDVTLNLYGLMQSVTKEQISPRSVDTACNCAKQIHKLLELNYKISKGRDRI